MQRLNMYCRVKKKDNISIKEKVNKTKHLIIDEAHNILKSYYRLSVFE